MKTNSLLALAASLALAAPALAGRDTPRPAASSDKSGKAGKKSGAARDHARAKQDSTCTEPAPVDPDLVAGLASYEAGQWAEAVARLSPWAAKPSAESDPAAARGFYSLSYAARQIGQNGQSDVAAGRAEPLLRARIETAHSLEAGYYLQALYQSSGDQTSQLGVVSTTLKAIDAGGCAHPSADDLFRIARLRGIAGDRTGQIASLERAEALLAKDPSPSPYRALTLRELGQASLEAGDAARAATRLSEAARLDPGLPGVHRAVGIALLRTGKVAEASEYWKAHWRDERDDGNGLIYAIPVLDDVVRLQPRHADAGVKDVAAYSTEALELGSKVEARTYLDLAARRAEARAAGNDLSADDQQAMDIAELRMAQLLVEYVNRGMDLQEFALKEGLLPAIHHRDLPTRK